MFVRRSRITLAGIAGLLALGAAACGSSSPSAPTVSADVTIAMVGDRGNQSYSPNPTTMRIGQTVAWKNNDNTTHNALEDAGERFASANVSPGATSTPRTMSAAGTFTYHCTLHPGMVGTLIVQ